MKTTCPRQKDEVLVFMLVHLSLEPSFFTCLDDVWRIFDCSKLYDIPGVKSTYVARAHPARHLRVPLLFAIICAFELTVPSHVYGVNVNVFIEIKKKLGL